MLPVLAGTEAKGKHLNKRNERENKQNFFLFYMIWEDCCHFLITLPFRQSLESLSLKELIRHKEEKA